VADSKGRDVLQLENPETQPWERLPRETEKAFRAFIIYRGLADHRLAPVAQQLNCSVANVFRWAEKYDWKERARQWDIYNDRLAQQAEIKDRAAMRKRFIEQGMLMQDIGKHGLAEYRKRLQIGQKLHLKPNECTALIKAGAEVESLGRGDPSEASNVVFEVNIAPLTDEEMKQYPQLIPDSGSGD